MIITSNIAGVYVFDKERLVDEHAFSAKDVIKFHAALEAGEWITPELMLVKKYPHSFYVGIKGTKHRDVKLTQDPSKLQFVRKYIMQKLLPHFRTHNILLTKQHVKAAINEDFLIIQATAHIDELKVLVNTLARRLREWYELYAPEFSRAISDHRKFAELILKKDKKELLQDINVKVEHSMGADLKQKDLHPIMELSKEIERIYVLIDQQEKYLATVLKAYCPNMQTICGTLIAAKLIHLAGSLHRLVLFPASTIQLLGAEKALFRHLKTGAPSPKHGVIIDHPLVSRAKAKGKAARMLANRISLCAKLDYFKGAYMAPKYLKELEARAL